MRSFVVVAGVLLTLCAGAVQAGPTYGFINITDNDSTNAAIGEAQLFVQVNEDSLSSVAFRFTNIIFAMGYLLFGRLSVAEGDDPVRFRARTALPEA